MKVKINKKKLLIIIFLTLILVLTFGIKEYNNSYDNRTYNELKNTINLNLTDYKINKDNNGKLVYITGFLNYDNNELYDNLFDIHVKTPRMLRYVETYQWIEHKNSKDLTYTKEWSSEIIDSTNFYNKDYQNPKSKYAENKWFEQETIKVKEFNISKKVFYEIQSIQKLKLNKDIKLPEEFKVYEEYITNSIDPKNPEIGDTRIIYFYSDWTLVSLLAKQNENTLEKYITKNNESILTIIPGDKKFEEVIKNYKDYVIK